MDGFSRGETINAKLTTPDSFDDVVKFYTKELRAPEIMNAPGADGGHASLRGGNAVFVQSDSVHRPISLRIFVIHEGDKSLTAVISRAAGEKETHICLTIFRRAPALPRL